MPSSITKTPKRVQLLLPLICLLIITFMTPAWKNMSRLLLWPQMPLTVNLNFDHGFEALYQLTSYPSPIYILSFSSQANKCICHCLNSFFFFFHVLTHTYICVSFHLHIFGCAQTETDKCACTLMYFSSLRSPHGTTQNQAKLIQDGSGKISISISCRTPSSPLSFSWYLTKRLV